LLSGAQNRVLELLVARPPASSRSALLGRFGGRLHLHDAL
jgi:hypothetical protein